MTETMTNWADKAFALLDEWTLNAFPSGMWNDPIQWRVGKTAYMEIAELVVGPPPARIIDDIGPQFKAISDEVERCREERLVSIQGAWGKEGSSLLGYPVVCDEKHEGLTLEEIK